MNAPTYNCDTVVNMEDLEVGTEEIIHYARACLPRREISVLVRGLEQLLSTGIAPKATSDAERIEAKDVEPSASSMAIAD